MKHDQGLFLFFRDDDFDPSRPPRGSGLLLWPFFWRCLPLSSSFFELRCRCPCSGERDRLDVVNLSPDDRDREVFFVSTDAVMPSWLCLRSEVSAGSGCCAAAEPAALAAWYALKSGASRTGHRKKAVTDGSWQSQLHLRVRVRHMPSRG